MPSARITASLHGLCLYAYPRGMSGVVVVRNPERFPQRNACRARQLGQVACRCHALGKAREFRCEAPLLHGPRPPMLQASLTGLRCAQKGRGNIQSASFRAAFESALAASSGPTACEFSILLVSPPMRTDWKEGKLAMKLLKSSTICLLAVGLLGSVSGCSRDKIEAINLANEGDQSVKINV